MDVDTKASRQEEAEEELVDWCNYVNQFDVCITTYNVLQQDLGIARPPPDRPRRSIATYINIERSRSPLVMCEWYRVIMDEVQMVGGGKTEYASFLASGNACTDTIFLSPERWYHSFLDCLRLQSQGRPLVLK